MMDDRQLLEAAAKAAGYQVAPHLNFAGEWVDGKSEMYFTDDGIHPKRKWNPLTDDGDALRLAVTMGQKIPTFCVCIMDDFTATYSFNSGIRGDTSHMQDPYAATRRAIVLAAAKMGE